MVVKNKIKNRRLFIIIFSILAKSHADHTKETIYGKQWSWQPECKHIWFSQSIDS